MILILEMKKHLVLKNHRKINTPPVYLYLKKIKKWTLEFNKLLNTCLFATESILDNFAYI
jgi:hypothetical protein